jgi:hypothetical protein
MQEQVKTSDILGELERIQRELSLKFKLKPNAFPLITLQSRGRKNVRGWYGSDCWDVGKKDALAAEINICAENINRNAVETLVHEMVHYSNAIDGVNDCSSTQYHNRLFKATAERFGLNVEKLEKYGFASTTLGMELKNHIDNVIKPDYKLFSAYRVVRETKKSATKMKKYTCGCGVNVRCAVELEATCDVCGTPFEKAEE